MELINLIWLIMRDQIVNLDVFKFWLNQRTCYISSYKLYYIGNTYDINDANQQQRNEIHFETN